MNIYEDIEKIINYGDLNINDLDINDLDNINNIKQNTIELYTTQLINNDCIENNSNNIIESIKYNINNSVNIIIDNYCNQKKEEERLKNKVIYLQNLKLPEQRSKEWYDIRRTRLTASSLATALNEDHFKLKSEIEINQKNYEKLIDEAADEISSFVEKANLENLS